MSEWSPTDMLGRGLEKLKADPVGLILPVFVVGLINGIPNGILSGVASGLQGADNGEGGILLILSGGVRFISAIVGLLISAYMTGGTMNLFLKVARGQEYQLSDIFGGGRWFMQMLVTLFLYQVLTGIGSMLCLVPGIIVGLGLQMAIPLVVDKDMGAVDALKESWRITTGHKMNLFVFGLLSFGAVLIGMFACCVGVFAVAPILGVAQAMIYVHLVENDPNAAAPGPAVF